MNIVPSKSAAILADAIRGMDRIVEKAKAIQAQSQVDPKTIKRARFAHFQEGGRLHRFGNDEAIQTWCQANGYHHEKAWIYITPKGGVHAVPLGGLLSDPRQIGWIF